MLGATYALEGFDAELYLLQRALVRLGFLNEATGRWSWDTYEAIGYADRYLNGPNPSTAVHAATNTITVDDAWVSALKAAPPPPAGTIGLWSSIPHASPWPKRLGIGAAAAAIGALGWWWYRKRCRR